MVINDMSLIMEKGYTATTTKDIAKKAEVNECTIFRKFKGKREIIIAAMSLPEWNPCLREEDFNYTGDLVKDLYDLTKDGIKEIPDTFKRVLVRYFTKMNELQKLQKDDIESLAVAFLAMNFGFVFFKASFGDELTELKTKEYIDSSVRHFVNGIGRS
jgi:hypothetical protein